MPDLLLELFSEEIPARMQAKAADDLRRMVTDKLVAEGLVYEGAKAFATAGGHQKGDRLGHGPATSLRCRPGSLRA